MGNILTKRQLATLDIISRGGTPTGDFMTREMIRVYEMDTSPQGVHQSAASLVRRGLAQRVVPGRGKPNYYTITAKGKAVLARNRETKRFLEMTGGRFKGTHPSEKDRAAVQAQTQALNSWMKGVLGG